MSDERGRMTEEEIVAIEAATKWVMQQDGVPWLVAEEARQRLRMAAEIRRLWGVVREYERQAEMVCERSNDNPCGVCGGCQYADERHRTLDG